jgi:hypothetical protein
MKIVSRLGRLLLLPRQVREMFHKRCWLSAFWPRPSALGFGGLVQPAQRFTSGVSMRYILWCGLSWASLGALACGSTSSAGPALATDAGGTGSVQGEDLDSRGQHATAFMQTIAYC